MNSLLDLLQRFKDKPDSSALIFSNQDDKREVISFGQLYNQALNFGGFLQSRGVGAGDRVALCMNHPVAWTICFWGIVASGAVVVPLNSKLSAVEAEKLCQLASAKLVVHNKKDFFTQNIPGVFLTDDMLLKNNSPLIGVDIKPESPAEIIFSSGTSGEPKGLVLNHKNLLTNLEQLRQVHKEIFAGSKFLCVLNLASSYQQMSGFFHPLCEGASIAVIDSVDLESFIKALVAEEISVVLVVPTMLKKFKDYVQTNHKEQWLKQVRKDQLHNFQFFISGGFALPEEVAKFWQDAGFVVLEGYGLTECSPVLTVNRVNRLKMGSVGTALPGVELKIENGEILAKGDNIFSGYLNNPLATQAAFTKDGWFKTGDLGSIDSEGFLYIEGRKEDVEEARGLGGLEVLKQAEQVLLGLDGIIEACVLNMTDKPVGVVVAPNLKADPGGILEQVNSKLMHKLEKVFIWPGPEFPKTATGKIQKFRLRERIALNLGV